VTTPDELRALGLGPGPASGASRPASGDSRDDLRRRLADAEQQVAQHLERLARLADERQQLAQIPAGGDPYGLIQARRIAVSADMTTGEVGLAQQRQRVAELRRRLAGA
jgi:hypothetical protein